MSLRRMVRLILSCMAVVAVAVSGATLPPRLDSVDEDLETVAAFREREPMPWTNWHVGIDSDLARAWAVRGFPTYVLVDDQGVILARGNGIDSPFFLSRLDEAVEGIAP